MQPEFPWNVAGLSPEAREAARAAARREGLSVGEWLTRQILRTTSEGTATFERAVENRHQIAPSRAAAFRIVANNAEAATRESEDMLARMSRDEDEALNAYRRVEERLSGVVRRLEAVERGQFESIRALSKTAAEINVASREQTQAFDQLDAHVTALADRLTRIEQSVIAGSAEHAAESRREDPGPGSDHRAPVEMQASDQVAMFVQTVESLTAFLAQAREDAEKAVAATIDHLVTVEERVRTIEEGGAPPEAMAELSVTLDQLNARFSASEAQTKNAITQLEESVWTLDERVDEALNELSARVSADEAIAGSNLARLEESQRTVEIPAGKPGYESRLHEIEQSLADMMARYDAAERIAFEAEETSLRALKARLEAAHPDEPNEASGSRSTPQAARTAPLPSAPIAAAREQAHDKIRHPVTGTVAEVPTASAGLHTRRTGVRRFGMIGVMLAGTLTAGLILYGNAPSAKQNSAIRPIMAATPRETSSAVAKRLPPTLAAMPSRSDDSAEKEIGEPAAAEPAAAAGSAKQPSPTISAPIAPDPEPRAAAALQPLEHLTAAAQIGNAKAQLVLGLKMLNGDGIAINEAEAARWLERAAKQGDPVAQYHLGTLYERGHGVPADARQAAAWYEAAANLGNRKAMHNLAVAYARGAGVTKDLAIAAQWFTKAANLGLRDSQFNLAVLYERGMGVPQSLPDAYKWYLVAAAQGDAESKTRVANLSTQLGTADRAAAQRAAEKFKPRPIDRDANVPPDLTGASAG